jgi:glutathione S-transferase
MTWIIYGSPISLFTRKLETALEAYGIDFVIRSKGADNRSLVEARAGTHQIPVLETPQGWMLADTTPILMWLDALYPRRRLFPSGALGVLVHMIEEVLDEWVSRVMVHYRWHYDENARFVIARITGQAVDLEAARQHPLAQWGHRACRATGTETISMQRAAEAEYLGLIAALEVQLATTRYALGDRPCAVDCALLGGLRAHTLHDPMPDLTAYPRVTAWAAAPLVWDGQGELAAFPDSTAFARHLLGLAHENYRPFILGNRAARAHGEKTFIANTYGEAVSYLARAYPETSRTLLADRIAQTLVDDEHRAVIAWLKAVGLSACFDAV